MNNNRGFTIVEVLVVVVILAAVGVITMIGIIPKIEKNAKENFINDGKLYLQAATKYYSDSVIAGEDFNEGCISIADLNKEDVGVTDKKSYSGYIMAKKSENGNISYSIAITNKKFYSYDSLAKDYQVNSSNFNIKSVLDYSDKEKDFPTNCP